MNSTKIPLVHCFVHIFLCRNTQEHLFLFKRISLFLGQACILEHKAKNGNGNKLHICLDGLCSEVR